MNKQWMQKSAGLKSMVGFNTKILAVIGLVMLLGLVGCAPRTQKERVNVNQLTTDTLSYYPKETGARWEYLAAGETVDTMPLVTYVEGPTLIESRRVIGWHTVGRGVDARAYKEYRNDGVFTHRETRPGATITFVPPVQEFPPVNSLGIGRQWGGTSTASIYFPEALPQDQRQVFTLNYRYTVIDIRKVQTRAGLFDVFVIDFESENIDSQGNIGEVLKQELWFTPYIGEIKNDAGLVLTATNFPVPNVPLLRN